MTAFWDDSPLVPALLLAALLHGLLGWFFWQWTSPLFKEPLNLQKVYEQAIAIELDASFEVFDLEAFEVVAEFSVEEPESFLSNPSTRALEMARLEALFAQQQQHLEARPRVRRISQDTPMTDEETRYLQEWEAQVKQISALYYPQGASQAGLTGRLRLLVAIQADGRIYEAVLLTSSGHRLLDQAALDLLNRAAPFAPLPEQLRQEADILEILRTWHFMRANAAD